MIVRAPSPQLSGRITRNDSVWTNVLCHYRKRADHGAMTNHNSREDRSSKPYPDVVTDDDVTLRRRVAVVNRPGEAELVAKGERADPIGPVLATGKDFNV